jgi:hypothetical protein
LKADSRAPPASCTEAIPIQPGRLTPERMRRLVQIVVENVR